MCSCIIYVLRIVRLDRIHDTFIDKINKTKTELPKTLQQYYELIVINDHVIFVF